MKSRQIRILAVLVFLFLSVPAVAAEDAILYQRTLQAARNHQYEFAFMNLRSLLRDYPASRYRDEALFGKAEYHFMQGDLEEARRAFEEYLRAAKDSQDKAFVLAYLWRIAQLQDNAEKMKDLQKRLGELQRVSLIFREFKEYKFVSTLQRRHRIIYHIDQFEFYVEDNLLANITY